MRDLNIYQLLTCSLQQLLTNQYQEEMGYFINNNKECLAYLLIGEKENKSGIPNHKLAALTRVSNTLINTTEAYYKN